jgi:hypothetical protein
MAERNEVDLAHLTAQLEKLLQVLRDEARRSSEFAGRLQEVLAPPPPPPEPDPPLELPKPKRRKALVDPFAVYETGWEAMLRQELGRLSVDQLRDVVVAYELDPGDRSERLKSEDELSEWIVKAVMNRAEKRS